MSSSDAEVPVLHIDESAQDSGSGYYAVTDDGPAPSLVASPHEGLPGIYSSGILYLCFRVSTC